MRMCYAAIIARGERHYARDVVRVPYDQMASFPQSEKCVIGGDHLDVTCFAFGRTRKAAEANLDKLNAERYVADIDRNIRVNNIVHHSPLKINSYVITLFRKADGV